MLKLDHITKVYRIGTFGGKELRAVDDVSFEVGDGRIVSLIGESGSGKSTIGRMILRLISTSSGSILFDGVDVSRLRRNALKDYYRKIQGVFQDPFSCYNTIFKADRIFRIVKDEFFPETPLTEWNAKVESALRDVGLNPDHVLQKYPHQLSGGQLQRFLIARALLLDIRFLVADEIISMLDASTRMDVLNLLADLKARGLAILFITHDLSLGYYVSDVSVILYKGCVVERGSSVKVYGQPLHPYTRMLMDSVASLERKWQETVVDLGTAHPELAGGCAFAARCPMADDQCRRKPECREIEPDHAVACWKVS